MTKLQFIILTLNIMSLILSIPYRSLSLSRLWEKLYGIDSSQFLKIARSNKRLKEKEPKKSKKNKDPYLLSPITIENLLHEYNRKHP